jgi:hypothetical protein
MLKPAEVQAVEQRGLRCGRCCADPKQPADNRHKGTTWCRSRTEAGVFVCARCYPTESDDRDEGDRS